MQDNPQALKSITQTMPQIGRLEAIIVLPVRRIAAIELAHTIAIAGIGLQDNRCGIESKNIVEKVRNRQVTLIQAEHVEVMPKFMRLSQLNATALRRNLVISGINY